jgi:hypothetical protein
MYLRISSLRDMGLGMEVMLPDAFLPPISICQSNQGEYDRKSQHTM